VRGALGDAYLLRRCMLCGEARYEGDMYVCAAFCEGRNRDNLERLCMQGCVAKFSHIANKRPCKYH
jgi:hypothetical protein